jgi:hypothetical protein
VRASGNEQVLRKRFSYLPLMLGFLPVFVWLAAAASFELQWRDADPLADTGRGFGAQLLYGILPGPVALLGFSLGIGTWLRQRRAGNN